MNVTHPYPLFIKLSVVTDSKPEAFQGKERTRAQGTIRKDTSCSGDSTDVS